MADTVLLSRRIPRNLRSEGSLVSTSTGTFLTFLQQLMVLPLVCAQNARLFHIRRYVFTRGPFSRSLFLMWGSVCDFWRKNLIYDTCIYIRSITDRRDSLFLAGAFRRFVTSYASHHRTPHEPEPHVSAARRCVSR